jgi:peptidoglycan hydrolase-like protein with peptidoglycan-binding domain
MALLLLAACMARSKAAPEPLGDAAYTARWPDAVASPGDLVDIGQAQRALREAGFDPGTMSGVLDTRTQTAIRQFQRAKGLPVTGQLDARTRAALLGRAPAGNMDRASRSGADLGRAP